MDFKNWDVLIPIPDELITSKSAGYTALRVVHGLLKQLQKRIATSLYRRERKLSFKVLRPTYTMH